jgi:rare lipoprotein A
MKTLITLFACLSLAMAQEYGIASHYSIRSNRGTHTASGEVLCDKSMTAAHKTLPFGSQVKVTNLNNGKTAVLRINNDGPNTKGRILDVSQAAAHALGFHKQGITKVKIEIISLGEKPRKK